MFTENLSKKKKKLEHLTAILCFKQRMHPKDYERFVALKDEEKAQLYHDRNEYRAQQTSTFEQSDFNRIVLNFMINGMHQPSLLEDPTFDTLLNGIHCFQYSFLIRPFFVNHLSHRSSSPRFIFRYCIKENISRSANKTVSYNFTASAKCGN